MPNLDKVYDGIENILQNVVGLKPEENLLILADSEADLVVVNGFLEIANDLDAKTASLICDKVDIGEEYPRMVATALTGADAMIGITDFHPAMWRTRAVWRATYEYGVRSYHIDPPHLLGLATAGRADCGLIALIAQRLLSKFAARSTLRIRSDNGTDLTYTTSLNRINAHDHFPLSHATVPIGAFVPHPIPGSVNGVMVFDALDGVAGLLEVPVQLTVRNGSIESIVGGDQANYLQEMFEKFKGTNFVGEIGFGINPDVPLVRTLSEKWHEVANRSAGIVHAGLGGSFLESTKFHRHVVIIEPTVQVIDTGHVLIDHGRLLVLDDPIIKTRVDEGKGGQ